jgi:hypothetical protein
LIVVSGQGIFRNNGLELLRALEIVQLLGLMSPLYKWELQYGEIYMLGVHVDALLKATYREAGDVVIGVEIVSKHDEKDVERARSRLVRLLTLNEIDRGFIYLRPLEDVQENIGSKLKLFKEVIVK